MNLFISARRRNRVRPHWSRGNEPRAFLINIKTKNEMRYCANVFCERHEFCLRYALGKRWHEENDLRRRGYYRGRRPGSWVAYRNTVEARKCTQFIDINERTK